MWKWGVIILFAVFVAAGCSRDTIDRSQWERMSREDRILYVRSLIGAEKVKEAKGGGGKSFDRPAEAYADSIDEAYARGDTRRVEEIFQELEPAR